MRNKNVTIGAINFSLVSVFRTLIRDVIFLRISVFSDL